MARGRRRRATRRVYRRRSRRGVGRHVTGLFPTLLFGAGAAAVFTTPDANGFSVASDLIDAFQNKNYTSLQNIPNHIISGVASGTWVAPVVGGVALSLIGKWFKLRRHTMITPKIAAL